MQIKNQFSIGDPKKEGTLRIWELVGYTPGVISLGTRFEVVAYHRFRDLFYPEINQD